MSERILDQIGEYLARQGRATASELKFALGLTESQTRAGLNHLLDTGRVKEWVLTTRLVTDPDGPSAQECSSSAGGVCGGCSCAGSQRAGSPMSVFLVVEKSPTGF